MSKAEIELWTNEEVNSALGLPEEALKWSATGVSIDTRTLKPGDLYIAIKGESLDGHSFVEEAFKKGAVAAIVDHPILQDPKFPEIIVRDTLKALSQLGRYARERTKATIIAVTGSVGKTSTKEMLRHVLQAFGKTHASPASYNNHWGLPLSLASMPRDTMYGVFEMGMNHRGELAPLAAIARPHIGVLTALADAHIGYMQSRQIIAEEKSDIFSAAPAPVLAIINQDMPEYQFICERLHSFGVSKIVGFGKSQEAAVRLINYQPDSTGLKGEVTSQIAGHVVNYSLPTPGEHVAQNTLISLAVGEALGLDQQQIIRQLETLPQVQGRGQHHRIPLNAGEILLIDDAYNANLTSMQAGLLTFAAIPLPTPGRRLVVLGEMLELGEKANDHHQQLMVDVMSHSVDLVFASGGTAIEQAYQTSIPKEKSGGYAPNADTLMPMVMSALQPGDIVFIKGSKGSKVSKIVDALKLKKNNTVGMAN
jgi:UDP-N-acetylmuramoyl-tripeptide--D-alanyl-D-alanine ligase